MNRTLRILLIDDDEDDKVLFMEALAGINKQIHFEYYNNGEQALKWLTSTPDLPNCIFLDLNMQRMNGIEILKIIKRELNTRHIPVVIYSTSSNTAHQHEAKRQGASLYIVKPYRHVDLKREILLAIETISPV